MKTKLKFGTILAMFRGRVVSLAGIYPLARKFLRTILQKATILYMRLLHKSPPQVSTRPFSMFNELKTAQLAAYLLKQGGGRMEYIKLINLLYLAEREHLKLYHSPMTGDFFVL